MSVLSALELLLPGGLAILMVAAAVGDVRQYRISNTLCLAVAAGGLLLIAVESALGADARLYDNALRQLSMCLIIAGVVFAGTAGLFASGVMGGGDVKLLTATVLWAGPQLSLIFLFITALAGGLVSLAVLVRSKRTAVAGPSPIVNPLDPNIAAPKVPYGLGIAAGGIYVAAELFIQIGRFF